MFPWSWESLCAVTHANRNPNSDRFPIFTTIYGSAIFIFTIGAKSWSLRTITKTFTCRVVNRAFSSSARIRFARISLTELTAIRWNTFTYEMVASIQTFAVCQTRIWIAMIILSTIFSWPMIVTITVITIFTDNCTVTVITARTSRFSNTGIWGIQRVFNTNPITLSYRNT